MFIVLRPDFLYDSRLSSREGNRFSRNSEVYLICKIGRFSLVDKAQIELLTLDRRKL